MAKVLVVRLSSLGDIILTQSVIEQIALAGNRVDLFVHPDYAGLGKLLPGVRQVITSIADLAETYDVLLDLHGTLRARRTIGHVKTKKKVRYQKKPLRRRLLVRKAGKPRCWNAWAGLSENEQVDQWYAKAAIAAGFNVVPKLPRIESDELTRVAAEQVLAKNRITPADRLAVFAPGAKWPTKRWPTAHFVQAAQSLAGELNLIPVFVGTHKERSLCEEAAKATGGKAVSLAGLTNIPVLAAILGRADILLANDSGPMHLGLAAGCAVVAFFGPTVSQFGFAPLHHPRARILAHDLTCRPCSLHGGETCPLKHHNCLREITPAEAVETVKALLAELPKKKRETV